MWINNICLKGCTGEGLASIEAAPKKNKNMLDWGNREPRDGRGTEDKSQRVEASWYRRSGWMIFHFRVITILISGDSLTVTWAAFHLLSRRFSKCQLDKDRSHCKKNYLLRATEDAASVPWLSPQRSRLGLIPAWPLHCMSSPLPPPVPRCLWLSNKASLTGASLIHHTHDLRKSRRTHNWQLLICPLVSSLPS